VFSHVVDQFLAQTFEFWQKCARRDREALCPPCGLFFVQKLQDITM
jgi:hypothetical protein